MFETTNHKSFIQIPTGRDLIKSIGNGSVKKSTVKWVTQNGIHLDDPLFFPYDLDNTICKSSDIQDLGNKYYDFCWCIFRDSHLSHYFLLFEDGIPVSIVYLDKYFGVKIIPFGDLILVVSKKGYVIAINLSTHQPVAICPLSTVEEFRDWIWKLNDVRIDGEYQIWANGEFKENSLFIRESSTGDTSEYFLDIRDYSITFEEKADRKYTFDDEEWKSLKEKKLSRLF